MEHGPSPRLLALPREIIEWIASQLEPADLFNLRLTCSEAASGTADTFKQTCFTDVPIMLSSQRSMQTLRDISQHHVFCRSVRVIRFSMVSLQAPEYFLRFVKENSVYENNESDPNDWERIVNTCIDQTILEEDFRAGMDLIYLMTILKNFKAVKNIPAIIMTDIESAAGCRSPPFGLAGRFIDEGLPLCRLVWKAIRETQYPIQRLEMGGEQQCPDLQMFCRSYPPNTYEHLKILRLWLPPLDIHNWAEYELRRDDQTMAVLAFTKNFLHSARNLELLELSVFAGEGGLPKYWRYCCVYFLALTNNLKHREPLFPKLNRLILTNQNIHPDVLLKFFTEHKETLAHVQLKMIRFDTLPDYSASFTERTKKILSPQAILDFTETYDGPTWTEPEDDGEEVENDGVPERVIGDWRSVAVDRSESWNLQPQHVQSFASIPI